MFDLFAAAQFDLLIFGSFGRDILREKLREKATRQEPGYDGGT